MENKCLVCGAIIPEGRQVCTTCKKGGKHEISKKLTDEEIIKAYFEGCNEEFCFNCPLSETDCCAEILELIHRLQSENKQLKCDSYRTSWKAKFLEAKKEIERLTEELEAKKKECREIADDYQEMGTFYYNETIKTAELQKQVDELKTENTELYKEHTTVIAGSILQKKQAVKDTAKEIYELIDAVKEVFPNDYRGYDMAHGWSMCVDKLKEIIKSKGAEVE